MFTQSKKNNTTTKTIMVKVIRTTPIDRSKRTAKKGDVVGEINIIPLEEKRARKQTTFLNLSSVVKQSSSKMVSKHKPTKKDGSSSQGRRQVRVRLMFGRRECAEIVIPDSSQPVEEPSNRSIDNHRPLRCILPTIFLDLTPTATFKSTTKAEATIKKRRRTVRLRRAAFDYVSDEEQMAAPDSAQPANEPSNGSFDSHRVLPVCMNQEDVIDLTLDDDESLPTA